MNCNFSISTTIFCDENVNKKNTCLLFKSNKKKLIVPICSERDVSDSPIGCLLRVVKSYNEQKNNKGNINAHLVLFTDKNQQYNGNFAVFVADRKYDMVIKFS